MVFKEVEDLDVENDKNSPPEAADDKDESRKLIKHSR
jgi:hypothetical protein